MTRPQKSPSVNCAGVRSTLIDGRVTFGSLTLSRISYAPLAASPVARSGGPLMVLVRVLPGSSVDIGNSTDSSDGFVPRKNIVEVFRRTAEELASVMAMSGDDSLSHFAHFHQQTLSRDNSTS
ncbi:hypothetical protein [Bradyrhizobium sp.]|jgi:hypothetical protein|uniref:hypothetical protein n=1 Tax=Bradyrhizobium sp. TaxID=376 RepID=UPI002D7E9250|nr:hypothetical protein [Bradyrhizobium sp.]